MSLSDFHSTAPNFRSSCGFPDWKLDQWCGSEIAFQSDRVSPHPVAVKSGDGKAGRRSPTGDQKGALQSLFPVKPALVAASHILNSTPMTRHPNRRISSAVGYTEFLSICTARCRPTHYRARLRIVMKAAACPE